MICPRCGNEMPEESTFCSKCGGKLDETKTALKNNNRNNKILELLGLSEESNDDYIDDSKRLQDDTTGSQYINYLTYISYIQLICSVISSIVIWATMGTTHTVDSIGIDTTSANPYGIILGIIVIISGIVLFILLQSLSHILKNSIENRNMLIELKQKIDKK